MDQRLRPIERLQTSNEFRRVFQRGRSFTSPALHIHYIGSERELSRIGLVVSRRRGKSHDRSRIKRLLREVFRKHKAGLPRILDVVLVPRGKGPRSETEYAASFRSFLEHLDARRERRARRSEDSRRAGAVRDGAVVSGTASARDDDPMRSETPEPIETRGGSA